MGVLPLLGALFDPGRFQNRSVPGVGLVATANACA